MSGFDPNKIAAEAAWLVAHPEFDQRPASIFEFLGDDYLGIERKVRQGIKDALIEIFGEDVRPDNMASFRYVMVTGAIGIGKTTFASIILPYMCHWVLCLRDPQDFFDLLPGSRIAFMMMSTSEEQARQVLFGDVFARIKGSRWFVDNYPYDDKYTKQIRFEKDIWILPGDSKDTTFEGYNILGGIIDEMDSHLVTKDKDYADDGYNTINSRIESRFGTRGLLVLIGQMKKSVGFASKMYKQFKAQEDALVIRMTIWESLGWERFLNPDGTRNSFSYDTRRKQIIPPEVALVIKNEFLIEVPNTYYNSFKNNPEKALKDLAGIPPATNDPFISLVDRVDECYTRWQERFGTYDEPSDSWVADSPVTDSPSRPQFQSWFTNRDRQDFRKRAMHLDLATSGDGDALGMAMGYVEGVVEIEGEKRPHIVIDFLLRIKVPSGSEIFLSEVRQIVYHLKDDLGFKIKKITMDGFQSTDTMQQFRKRRFEVELVSVDKSTLPYEDLREAIYDRRIDIPPYMTYMAPGSEEKVNISLQELSQLQFDGKKVDHTPEGSKDVADAIAGVTTTLMGDRQYRRGVVSLDAARARRAMEDEATGTDNGFGFPGSVRDIERTGPQAPIPPMVGIGLVIPARLRPNR